jgi:two-component system, cell cycle response regulator DivK
MNFDMTAPQPPAAPMVDTILIVEDHALVAKFYCMALERAGGFSCLLNQNIAEILAAVESGAVDLAILDISLRGSEWEGRPIDGLELARLIRQRTPRSIPIILATAHAMAGDHQRLLETSGADACLEKPIYDADQLVGLVRNLLAIHREGTSASADQAPPDPDSNPSTQT